jgi:hypothetical protein
MAYLTTRIELGLGERLVVRVHPGTEHRQRSLVPHRHELPVSPSVTTFLAKFMAASLALMALPILVAATPQKVTVPLGVVFMVGIAASGIAALAARWQPRGEIRHARSQPSRLRRQP